MDRSTLHINLYVSTLDIATIIMFCVYILYRRNKTMANSDIVWQ